MKSISGIFQRINYGEGVCHFFIFLMNRLSFKLNPKVKCALSVKGMRDSDLWECAGELEKGLKECCRDVFHTKRGIHFKINLIWLNKTKTAPCIQVLQGRGREDCALLAHALETLIWWVRLFSCGWIILGVVVSNWLHPWLVHSISAWTFKAKLCWLQNVIGRGRGNISSQQLTLRRLSISTSAKENK